MGGGMGGGKSPFKDCFQQLKIIFQRGLPIFLLQGRLRSKIAEKHSSKTHQVKPSFENMFSNSNTEAKQTKINFDDAIFKFFGKK